MASIKYKQGSDISKDQIIIEDGGELMVIALALIDKAAIIRPTINNAKDITKYTKRPPQRIVLDASHSSINKDAILNTLNLIIIG